MAKKKNKKPQEREISFVPLLWMGFIIVIANAVLNNLLPNYPSGLSTIVYVIGISAMVVYMIQVRFEKRTGQKEIDKSVVGKNKGKKK